MHDFGRVLRYAFRHRGKIAGVVVCALAAGLFYGGPIAGVLPVVQLVLSPRGLAAMEDWSQVQASPRLQGILTWALSVLPDQGTPQGRFETYCWLTGILVLALALGGLFRFFQDYLVGIISTNIVYDLRNELYARVIRQDLAFFSEAGAAKTMSRFTVDMQLISRGVVALLGGAIREPLKAVVCVTLALSLDWQLTLLSLVAGPLVGVAIYLFGRAIKRYSRRVLGHFSLLNTILQETFLGIPIVKAFSMERYEMERFRQRNARLRHNQIRVERADAATSPAIEILAMLAVVLVVLVPVRRVVAGEMELAVFVTLYAALIAMFDPLRKLSRLNNRIQETAAAGRRVFELIDAQPRVEEAPDAVVLPRMTRALTFDDVHFAYTKDGPEALRGVTLKIAADETVAIVGHSGAGKTTLINLVPRFYDPTAGRVAIDGVDLSTATLESVRRQIALVTQNVVLFEDTVANNIAYGHHECPMARIKAAARAANAHDFIIQLPEGYQTRIGERGESLSGGQRARLAIARAVLRDPAILILDEATANIDSESEALIQDALQRLQAGRTTIVIAHRLSTVQHADRVVVLDHGRVESVGTHEELLVTSPIYRSLHDLQFGVMPEPHGPAAEGQASPEGS